MPRSTSALVAGCLLLSACISSAPPAPAVRFFDCPVKCEALGGASRPLPLPRVGSVAGLEQPFALRVGGNELRFDGDHQWLMPPDRLVQAALTNALYVDGPCTIADGRGVEVLVTSFEFDLTSAPAAVVELQASLDGRLRVFRGRATAAAVDPALLTAAMTKALTEAVTALRAALCP